MNKLAAVLVLSAVGVFASAGCAVDSGADNAPAATPAERPTAAEEENIHKTEAALISGGSSSFSCGALGCICNGDEDCNNLFGSGACGTWPAKCYQRGPSQYCICAPWVGRTIAATGGAVTGVGTVGALAQ